MVDHSLVEAFWTNYRLAFSADRAERLDAEEHFWAWETVEKLVRQGDPDAVEVISALADAVANDDAALAYLGAGPLEDLVLVRGGAPSSELIGAVETAARRNRSFRQALGGVWWSDDDEAIRSRLARFLPQSD